MNQEQIGKFIARLRREKKLTQEQLAEKLSVNVKSVSRWETGRNLPDFAVMRELCEVLDISVNELLEGKKIKRNRNIRQIVIFYIVVSITGIFVLPMLGLLSPTLILGAILVPILSTIKLIASFFHYDMPYIMFQFGAYTLNPFLSFFVITSR